MHESSSPTVGLGAAVVVEGRTALDVGSDPVDETDGEGLSIAVGDETRLGDDEGLMVTEELMADDDEGLTTTADEDLIVEDEGLTTTVDEDLTVEDEGLMAEDTADTMEDVF